MPTPLAHGLAGFATGRSVRSQWKAWHFAALAFAIAQIADLDFLPGVLIGDPGLFHRGGTHSIAGALLLSAPLAAALAWLAPAPGADTGATGRFLRWYVFVVPVYASHLLLDLFSPNSVHNSGLKLLWPFTETYIKAPAPIPHSLVGFFALEFGPDTAGFFRTFFSLHALGVYVGEAVLFSPILAVPWLVARFRRGMSPESKSAAGGRSMRRVAGGEAPTRAPARVHPPEPADVPG